MKSLATVITYQIEEANNEEVFEKTLLMLYPELYQIHQALEETNINPGIIPKIIRSLYNVVTFGKGFGIIKIVLVNGQITTLTDEQSYKLDMPALAEEKIYTTSENIEVTELDNTKKQE